MPVAVPLLDDDELDDDAAPVDPPDPLVCFELGREPSRTSRDSLFSVHGYPPSLLGYTSTCSIC